MWFQVLPVIWQAASRGLGHMGCCWTCNSWWQTLAENLSSRKNNLLGCNSTHKLLYNSNIWTVNIRLAIWRHRYCAADFLINPWVTKLIENVILTMQHFNCKNKVRSSIQAQISFFCLILNIDRQDVRPSVWRNPRCSSQAGSWRKGKRHVIYCQWIRFVVSLTRSFCFSGCVRDCDKDWNDHGVWRDH